MQQVCDALGNLLLFGCRNKTAYALAPPEQYIKGENDPLMLDEAGTALDTATQRPPHELQQLLCDLREEVYHLLPLQLTVQLTDHQYTCSRNVSGSLTVPALVHPSCCRSTPPLDVESTPSRCLTQAGLNTNATSVLHFTALFNCATLC